MALSKPHWQTLHIITIINKRQTTKTQPQASAVVVFFYATINKDSPKKWATLCQND